MSDGHVDGALRYAQDTELEGQWHAALVRSLLPHARVRGIDTSALPRECVALLPEEFVGAAGLPKAEELLRRAAPTTQAVAENPASAVQRLDVHRMTHAPHPAKMRSSADAGERMPRLPLRAWTSH